MTTTVTPAPAHAVDLTVTLTSPLHHGAGSSGNTSLLRAHEIALPDGTHTRVPFLSANSIRHGLRDALAWHTATTLNIEDGTLPKGLVDLLWSGGAVTTTGAQVDLDLARRIEDTYPALSLLGYAAQSDIIAGTLRVSDLEVVARENAWRLPAHLTKHPGVARGVAAYRTEEFGTRHDIASSPVARFIDAAQQATGTQMIYDVQALKAGTTLYGRLALTPAATAAHHTVLLAALALWAPDGVVQLGAKNSVGFGSARVEGIEHDAARDALAQWTQHLTARREEIIPLLTEVSK